MFNDFADGYISELIAPAEVNLSQVVAIGGKLQHRTVCQASSFSEIECSNGGTCHFVYDCSHIEVVALGECQFLHFWAEYACK